LDHPALDSTTINIITVFLGYVRDNSDYTVALHCLNIATFVCATSWTIEMAIVKRREKMSTKIDAEDLELN